MDSGRELTFYEPKGAMPNKNTRSPTNNMARPSLPKNRYDFKIAIICALPLEVSAVCALFDQRWDDQIYGKAPNDFNNYSTGMIGHHNVVLVHMPNMGEVAGAAAAACLRASFRGIHLALMVGICGGVPGKQPGRNILLGDVVISDDLVQYDPGRQYSSRRFMRKDMPRDNLPTPNPEIRAALIQFQTEQERSWLHNKTLEYLEILQKRLGDVGTYPGAAEDRLFKSAYRHKHHRATECVTCANKRDDLCKVATEMNCKQLQCDAQELVPRTQASVSRSRPIVHFGLVASGDTMMKSGEDRDEIATRDGIIAFEVEGAARVWDHFPSLLVIKGICDYADSHKNEKWQGYAVATAAAVTKVFLENWIAGPSYTMPPSKPTLGTVIVAPPTTLQHTPPPPSAPPLTAAPPTTPPFTAPPPTAPPSTAPPLIAPPPTAPPVTSPPFTVPPPGDYNCGNLKPLYSTGEWTYVEMQICLRLYSSQASIVLKLREGQYKLGRAFARVWCYASPDYPMQWTVSGSVQGVGDYHRSGNTRGPSSENIVGELGNIMSGTYTISVNYSQVGPYWEADATIHNSETFTITLP